MQESDMIQVREIMNRVATRKKVRKLEFDNITKPRVVIADRLPNSGGDPCSGQMACE